jgi:nucleotide-binding universal stress UspA family protein
MKCLDPSIPQDFWRFPKVQCGIGACTTVQCAALTPCDHWRLELKRLSRVLVAVAIDDRDRHVFAHALALARRHDARLLFLHATSPEVSLNRGATQRVEFLRQLRSLADAAGVEVRVGVQTVSESPADGVLCAVDFSPASQAAVREAVRLSAGGNRPVTLLHVMDAAGSSLHVHSASLATHEFHRGLGADALTTLQSLIPQEDEGSAVAHVTVGRPVPEILRAARAMKAQLIVIGAARRTRIGSRLFGETGQLLRDATCPILAVPVSDAANLGAEHVHREAA